MLHLRRAIPVAFGLLSLVMINPAFAQVQSTLRLLTVTGQGSESVATSLSQVTVGVEIQGETAEAVQQEVANRSNAVINLLRSKANITKLQTTGLYLNPVYDYSNNTSRITGYTGVNTVSFRIPTAETGALLDELIQTGATRIDGISFVADDAAIAMARQQAIQEAIQDAQTQANAAFAALNLTPGEVVGVQVNGASYGPPLPYPLRAADMAAQSAPTPVVGGEQEVQASVTLQISY
jgi:uncharacterized protein YggE